MRVAISDARAIGERPSGEVISRVDLHVVERIGSGSPRLAPLATVSDSACLLDWANSTSRTNGD